MTARLSSLLAFALGVAAAVCQGKAFAQPQTAAPSWSERCRALVAAGMPSATVRSFHDAMAARGGSTPEEKARHAAEIVRQLPQQFVVGVVEVTSAYLRATGEIKISGVQTSRFLLGPGARPGERNVDVAVITETRRGDSPDTDYAMTVVANITLDPGDFGPRWPTADGERRIHPADDVWGFRFKVTAAPTEDLLRHLRLIVAGVPRPPFTNQHTTPPPLAPNTREGLFRMVHVEPHCAAIVDARSGQAVHIIR